MTGGIQRGPLCQGKNPLVIADGTSCQASSARPGPRNETPRTISTYYPKVHADGEAAASIKAIPIEDTDLQAHRSILGEKNQLFALLHGLTKGAPDKYRGEIYSKVLKPGAMRSNYASAALNTADTPVDNRTRYALQVIMVKYVITYGRDFKRYRLGEFSYALHERAFRWAGRRSTIGLLPWAVLESVDVPGLANFDAIALGDRAIVLAIEQLNAPDGRVSELGFLVRQYIDYTSQLWESHLPDEGLPEDAIGGTIDEIINHGGWKLLFTEPFGK